MMKKLLFMFVAVALLFTACNKDKDQIQDPQNGETGLSFTIQQTDMNFKDTDPGPECNDELSMDYVVFTLGGVDYTSEIYMVNGEQLTQVVKLPTGVYALTNFLVYSENGTPGDMTDDVIIKAAPMPGSEYHDLMMYPLDVEVTVDAFYKKQYPVDVLCFEPLYYDEFGFTWFQFNDVRIEYQCVFGDICVDDFELYAESLYENQVNGIQFDIPAIFEVKVFKGDDIDPLRVFSNAEWYGEGRCLEVYWPNRLDEEGEVFNFELWVLLPTVDGFEYVLMDTWSFVDGEGATTGEDGVVDFVIGDCHLYPADYEYEYTMEEGYVPLHDPVLELQFDELNNHNMHITSNGSSYFTINGGDNNGLLNEYDMNANFISTHNIAFSGRGLSYNKADGFLYASIFPGDVVKITDIENGTFEMLYQNKLQNSQASFALSEDGTKFYDFYLGTLKVWDLATGTLIETINGLSNGAGNFGGNACVAVDPDYIYTWDSNIKTVFVYDHSGVYQQSIILSDGDNGHSLSFVDGILFVSRDGNYGIGTWYGYNIRNAVTKKMTKIHSISAGSEMLKPDTDDTRE